MTSANNANEKLFVPFELSSDPQCPLYGHDPDFQIYNDLCKDTLQKCEYFNECSFNRMCDKNEITNSKLSLLHANIRSLPRNGTALEPYFSTLKVEFNVVALTETWLNETNADVYGLTGYKAIHNYRKQKKGGGVSLFIEENIRYIDRDDLLHMNDYIECVLIELEKGEMGLGSNAVVGVIYRPPGTEIKIFNEQLQGILQSINSDNKKCYLLGDYNINLLNIDKHTDTNEFLDMMYTHSLFPNVTKPTRIYGKSSMLIDNIFSNDLLGTTQTLSGILETDISDHYPVFHIVDMSLYPKENLKLA